MNRDNNSNKRNHDNNLNEVNQNIKPNDINYVNNLNGMNQDSRLDDIKSDNNLNEVNQDKRPDEGNHDNNLNETSSVYEKRNKGEKITEKKPRKLYMVLYTCVIVLATGWSVFAVVNTYFGQMNEDGETNITQEVTEQVVVKQEEAQIDAIESVKEAIVGIVSVNSSFNDSTSEGSGIVYKVSEGDTYIVTNEHVITDGQFHEVVFDNENNDRLEAEVVGSDALTDLAVLRIRGYEASTVAEFGNTEDLQIGQTVIAIGNPLGLDFAGSATAGIVSGHDRTIRTSAEWEMTVLQTDAAINPGNSGGALISLDGKVVGINSMKIKSDAVEGMSFAIPTYEALPIMEDLETYGEVLRPTLGVNIMDMNTIPDRFKQMLEIPLEQKDGIYVEDVVAGSLAESMGIRAGDVITALNGVDVETSSSFRKELFNYREGDEITITLLRGGESLDLTTTVVIIPKS